MIKKQSHVFLRSSLILESLNNKRYENIKNIERISKTTWSSVSKRLNRYMELGLINRIERGRYALTDKGREVTNHIIEIRRLSKKQ